MNQNQIFVGFNSRFSQSISFFGNYSLVHNNSDTEGQGVEGVLVAHGFTVRIETPQGAFLAEYSVKDVKLNQPVGDDVFVIPN